MGWCDRRVIVVANAATAIHHLALDSVREQAVAAEGIVHTVAEAAAGTVEATGTSAGGVLTSASELSVAFDHFGTEVGRFLASGRAA